MNELTIAVKVQKKIKQYQINYYYKCLNWYAVCSKQQLTYIFRMNQLKTILLK